MRVNYEGHNRANELLGTKNAVSIYRGVPKLRECQLSMVYSAEMDFVISLRGFKLLRLSTY